MGVKYLSKPAGNDVLLSLFFISEHSEHEIFFPEMIMYLLLFFF